METNKIISVINQKGGTGKTTTAVTLSAFLSKYAKRKVLVIDMDGQANLTTSINVKPEKDNLTSFELLLNDIDSLDISKLIYKSDDLLFDVICSNDKLNNIDTALATQFERETRLLDNVKDLKSQYDYIIIDCSPSLNLATVNSLVASDYVLIPIQADYLSVNGTSNLLSTINTVKKRLNPELEVLGAFVTMYDSRKGLDNDILDIIKEQFKEKAFNTCIRSNVKIKEAPMYKKDIFSYDSNCNGSIDYYNLCIEIWKRLGGKINEKK